MLSTQGKKVTVTLLRQKLESFEIDDIIDSFSKHVHSLPDTPCTGGTGIAAGTPQGSNLGSPTLLAPSFQ